MRIASAALSVGCLFISLIGCGGDEEAPPPSPLAPRLEEAKAVADSAARDKELDKLALEAGTAGDVAVASDAVAAIGNEALREKTKVTVVLRLAKAGKTDGAAKLEQTIVDVNTRSRLHLKMRTREFSE